MTNEIVDVYDSGKGGILNATQDGYDAPCANDVNKPSSLGLRFANEGIAAGLMCPYIGVYQSMIEFNKLVDNQRHCYAFELGDSGGTTVINGDPILLQNFDYETTSSYNQFVRVNDANKDETVNFIAFLLTKEQQSGIFHGIHIKGIPQYPPPFDANRSNVFYCLVDPNVQTKELLVSYGKSFGGNSQNNMKDEHIIKNKKMFDFFMTEEAVTPAELPDAELTHAAPVLLNVLAVPMTDEPVPDAELTHEAPVVLTALEVPMTDEPVTVVGLPDAEITHAAPVLLTVLEVPVGLPDDAALVGLHDAAPVVLTDREVNLKRIRELYLKESKFQIRKKYNKKPFRK
jgi:hypothetical protein